MFTKERRFCCALSWRINLDDSNGRAPSLTWIMPVPLTVWVLPACPSKLNFTAPSVLFAEALPALTLPNSSSVNFRPCAVAGPAAASNTIAAKKPSMIAFIFFSFALSPIPSAGSTPDIAFIIPATPRRQASCRVLVLLNDQVGLVQVNDRPHGRSPRHVHGIRDQASGRVDQVHCLGVCLRVPAQKDLVVVLGCQFRFIHNDVFGFRVANGDRRMHGLTVRFFLAGFRGR